jgi:hypothetical protein
MEPIPKGDNQQPNILILIIIIIIIIIIHFFYWLAALRLELLQPILFTAIQLSAPVFLMTDLQTILQFYNTL